MSVTLQYVGSKPVETNSDYVLRGHIAGDTFASKGNSHFADMDGNVVCGTKNRFGMDCSMEIRFTDMEHFETDETIGFTQRNVFAGTALDLRKNHLPLSAYITCKKCRKKLEEILTQTELSIPNPLAQNTGNEIWKR